MSERGCRSFTVRIPRSLYERIDALAFMHRRSLTAEVECAIRDHLDDQSAADSKRLMDIVKARQEPNHD